ncbi:unnamed protein product [Phytophthora lilii]|uniref:Unnamed protein product n=1 Tax=Phytophthora lilii TaxID=2077276 RepID=A0A9W6WS68_9STRA|nr:unnamed protein product [Phytophthora lilii]
MRLIQAAESSSLSFGKFDAEALVVDRSLCCSHQHHRVHESNRVASTFLGHASVLSTEFELATAELPHDVVHTPAPPAEANGMHYAAVCHELSGSLNARPSPHIAGAAVCSAGSRFPVLLSAWHLDHESAAPLDLRRLCSPPRWSAGPSPWPCSLLAQRLERPMSAEHEKAAI